LGPERLRLAGQDNGQRTTGPTQQHRAAMAPASAPRRQQA
jgi:hypothetical protein